MQRNDLLFPQNDSVERLTIIRDINFTRREIDVIACLLNARGTSKISSLLTIAPTTVVTHIHNIMLKLGCNTREGIIDFIERSGKLSTIRNYYANLIVESLFKKSLKEISKLKREKVPACMAIYWQDQNFKNALIHHLEGHLNHAGIKVKILDQEINQNIQDTENSDQVLLFLLEKKGSQVPQGLPNADFVDLTQQQSYYLSVFEILKKLYPSVHFENLFKRFEEQYEGMQSSLDSAPLQAYKDGSSKNHKLITLFKRKDINLFVALFCIGLFWFGFKILKGNKEMQVAQTNGNLVKSSIRSDLIIPTESALLHRPEEMMQINEKFNGQRGIQTVALIGPGGAGKTTLARQYTHQEKADVIWEVNAETHEGLNDSFATLAQALAKTEEDQKLLKSFLDISNLTEREEKVISFVKEGLKAHSSWALIFDNIEKFTDIQKHFPQDAETWGKGKIILTTRDSTIQNNKHIHSTLQIGELTPTQKLTLFTKIMTNGNENSFPTEKREEANQFLEKIPPYPLDVSVAAYYLKTTNAPFEGYIKNVNLNNKDFASIQENLLKEAGTYTQTRYGILTLSLQRLINTDKDFSDLLFFISLLDSQNIPRELLEKHKNNMIVDNFILNLKKYSLITGEPSLPFLGKTISLHRSTQSISLAYLKNNILMKKKESLLASCEYTLKSYAEEARHEENLPKMRVLESHLNSFLSHENLINDILQNSIKSELGFIYSHLRYDDKSKKTLEEAFDFFKKAPGNHHKNLMNISTYLANVHMELGNFHKAKELIDDCLQKHKKYYLSPHIYVARGLTNMGYIYQVVGEYEKAKDILEQSLVIYSKHFPKHYVGEAQAAAYLGNVNWFLGNYEKAKNFLEQGLVIYEKFFPESLFDIAAFHIFLGNVYVSLGEYEKAVNLLEHGIELYGKILPENHIEIAWASVHMANAYEQLGQYAKARALLEKSRSINDELFGDDNVRSADVFYHLAKLDITLGKPLGVKDLLNKALAVYEKVYGKNHVKTARILRGFGQASLGEGDLVLAESYFNEALKPFQKSDHTDQFMVLESLAHLYLAKSKLAEDQGHEKVSKDSANQAISFLHQALEVVKTRFPENSPHLKRIHLKLKSLE